MFLNALRKQNPTLIDTAIMLWQQGKIGPDTYVIDVDQTLSNARSLLDEARRCNIKLYLMSKQFGRNPELCKRLLACGYQGVVAVDFKEVRQLYQHGIPVAHVGHLVQPPSGMVDEIVSQQPEVITIFSLEKAQQISDAARKQGKTQPIMLKVNQAGDLLYAGQEGGFELNQLPEVIQAIANMPAVRLVGVTHFPCMLFNPQEQRTLPTTNMFTLLAAKEILEKQGVNVEQVNAPSAACIQVMPELAQLGVTHTEPGHALTGTIPANQDGSQPEKVSLLYLSEISHHVGDTSYFFGGGYYRRGHLSNALIWHNQAYHSSKVLPVDDSSIDYCLRLSDKFPIGSPLVMSFRTQIFVTRSDVALVEGIQRGEPKLIGRYDSQGNSLN
ncbi:hypothetical protein PL78_15390 [Yersinia entomophaga]|uniref:Alanine racemase N-terminal domain-containing protein n=1 Tax=Yersinia entomophaga TaxID=935293 RepID=A0ABM6BNR8_YERET|nr:YhfX family PLP-dependent enzyme [Yersinia entomophaga]ANI31199.1 hypothetical protein PL78_15390 [Yersinia entomophaga]OWF89993.1 hypothetical protein B4914_00260 [Yersinia entomophaga]